MEKSFLAVIVIIVVAIIIISAVLMFLPKTEPGTNNQTPIGDTGSQQQIVEGIQVNAPKQNEAVSSPFKISGSVNAGGWSGFEGQVGTVKLLDNKGNVLSSAVLKAISDWTKPPIRFESTITLKSKYTGQATLLFSNENPSGMPAKNKQFGLSVIIK